MLMPLSQTINYLRRRGLYYEEPRLPPRSGACRERPGLRSLYRCQTCLRKFEQKHTDPVTLHVPPQCPPCIAATAGHHPRKEK